MRRLGAVGLVASLLVCAGAFNASTTASNASTSAGRTVLVSVSTSGEQGNGESGSPSISADGTRVVFASLASNLVPHDTNGAPDAFVRDLEHGWTRRVSVRSDGSQISGTNVSDPVISGNGRWVAFYTYDDTVVPGRGEGSFLHDLRTGKTIFIGNERGAGDSPALSYDGRFVAFVAGDRLIKSDHNYENDVYVWDRVKDRFRIASLTAYGTPTNGSSDELSISADGGCVAFRSWATNLIPGFYTSGGYDVYAHDMVHGGTTRVGGPNDDRYAPGGGGGPLVDAQGTQVLFVTNMPLVSDRPSDRADILTRNLLTNRTSMVSVTDDGRGAGGYEKSVTGDGRYVALYIAEPDDDGTANWHFVVRDLRKKVNHEPVPTADGEPALHNFGALDISLRGNALAFDSWAPNWVTSDTNDTKDVFVRTVDFASGWNRPDPPRGCGNGLEPVKRPRCFGEKADWIGQRWHDSVIGTKWAESHVGLRGKDGVLGGSGHDRVCGNAGNDLVDGGPGRDRLSGGKGDDLIRGGGAHDVCIGGPGRDEAEACEVTRSIP